MNELLKFFKNCCDNEQISKDQFETLKKILLTSDISEDELVKIKEIMQMFDESIITGDDLYLSVTNMFEVNELTKKPVNKKNKTKKKKPKFIKILIVTCFILLITVAIFLKSDIETFFSGFNNANVEIEIKGDGIEVIDLFSSVNLDSYITTKDKDGNIVQVIKKGSVDTSKEGKYTVEYNATDDKGRTATKYIEFQVKAPKLSDEEDFVLRGLYALSKVMKNRDSLKLLKADKYFEYEFEGKNVKTAHVKISGQNGFGGNTTNTYNINRVSDFNFDIDDYEYNVAFNESLLDPFYGLDEFSTETIKLIQYYYDNDINRK